MQVAGLLAPDSGAVVLIDVTDFTGGVWGASLPYNGVATEVIPPLCVAVTVTSTPAPSSLRRMLSGGAGGAEAAAPQVIVVRTESVPTDASVLALLTARLLAADWTGVAAGFVGEWRGDTRVWVVNLKTGFYKMFCCNLTSL